MSPPTVLLEHLADARRRGLALEDAWPAAVVAATAGLGPSDREQWLAAFSATRDAWGAGYTREVEAARPLRALTLLAEDRDVPDAGADPCEHCHGPMPPGSLAGRRRRYCSAKCRNRAHAGSVAGLAA